MIEKMSTPSLYHLILGGGFEVSLQVKVMFPPIVIVVIFCDIGGSPEGSNNGTKKSYCFTCLISSVWSEPPSVAKLSAETFIVVRYDDNRGSLLCIHSTIYQSYLNLWKTILSFIIDGVSLFVCLLHYPTGRSKSSVHNAFQPTIQTQITLSKFPLRQHFVSRHFFLSFREIMFSFVNFYH